MVGSIQPGQIGVPGTRCLRPEAAGGRSKKDQPQSISGTRKPFPVYESFVNQTYQAPTKQSREFIPAKGDGELPYGAE
jgi:hypothetical protein